MRWRFQADTRTYFTKRDQKVGVECRKTDKLLEKSLETTAERREI